MFQTEENNRISEQTTDQKAEAVWEDFESRNNLVGLYNLALKIAKENPELWAKINGENND